MNVLRMIKWFAWESKIKEDIGNKRQEELNSIRNARLLVVLNSAFKCVISSTRVPILIIYIIVAS